MRIAFDLEGQSQTSTSRERSLTLTTRTRVREAMTRPSMDRAGQSSPPMITVPSGVSVVSTRAASPIRRRSRFANRLRSDRKEINAMSNRPRTNTAMVTVMSIQQAIGLRAVETRNVDSRFQIPDFKAQLDESRNSKDET